MTIPELEEEYKRTIKYLSAELEKEKARAERGKQEALILFNSINRDRWTDEVFTRKRNEFISKIDRGEI